MNRATPPDPKALMAALQAGAWQMSWFDKYGPYGDSPRDTCDAAINELSKRGAPRLGPKGEPQPQWKLEEWA